METQSIALVVGITIAVMCLLILCFYMYDRTFLGLFDSCDADDDADSPRLAAS